MAIINTTKSRMYSKEIEAKDIKVGDFRVWNDGSFSKVVNIKFSKTGKTLDITCLYYDKMSFYNGSEWCGEWKEDTRRCRATQKINIVEEESLLIAEENNNIYTEEHNRASKINKNINDEIVGNEAVEIKEEIITPIQEPTNENAEIESIDTLEMEVKFNQDKNGIELYFKSIPKEEIRESLKTNSFRWSKFNKCWYSKDTQEAREFLIALGYKESDKTESQQTTINIEVEGDPVINIDDIGSYTIPQELSRRENNLSMFRTKDVDRQKEIQEILLSWNNATIEALNGNNDELFKYKTYRKLQSLKKRYYNLYVKMLTHKANNPAWFVTGRGGLNTSRYNKRQSQYEKMIRESIKIDEEFKSFISSIKLNIKRNKNKIV